VGRLEAGEHEPYGGGVKLSELVSSCERLAIDEERTPGEIASLVDFRDLVDEDRRTLLVRGLEALILERRRARAAGGAV
jgi:hypothetical protein